MSNVDFERDTPKTKNHHSERLNQRGIVNVILTFYSSAFVTFFSELTESEDNSLKRRP